MNSQFYHTASGLSDEELNDRIENRQKYLPETTEATITELQQRGHTFSEEELNIINQDIKAQRENVALYGKGSLGLSNNKYKSNLVDDPEAPMFYSRRAIYIHCTFRCVFWFHNVSDQY
jgi:hypothetical protein